MTATPTKIQRAKRYKNLTARQIANIKYYDKAYRSKKSKNNNWISMFIGNASINEIWKLNGITP